MRGQNTIVINGKVYDAVTGLAVGAPDPVTPSVKSAVKKPSTGQSLSGIQKPARGRQLVRKAQKSQTLKRQHLKKPATHKTPIHQARVPRAHQAVSRSHMISKFAQPVEPTKPVEAATENQSTTI
ncbi:MAG TPA: hypothetical protein VFG56_02395, partial [Candidatus Saccharimonadales bacterium]|nr:hypothetical protein [Candidatus Saccharimonadales bacterium]